MHLQANIITIRDARTHTKKDIKAILAGKIPVMHDDKIFWGATAFDDDDQEILGTPEEVEFECHYRGESDIAFRGDETKEVQGKHWLLGGQGLRKLVNAHGFWCVTRLVGGTPGTATARLIVKFRGMVAEILLPYVD